MASLLRQIVAGPRARHPEAGLDLCYVTDNIIATSGPSQTYPQRAYRNPLDRLVAFLDSKHGENWAIWEFRGEGTGYPDELVYNRIRHYPWPDHHPPPFRLVPLIVASMRNWLGGNDLDADGSGRGPPGEKLIAKVLDALQDSKKNGRVVVVHCKAGKGRSGTMACSYLIAECGWTPEQALARFTERRMRPKFGPGVSIPSQLRWVGYVDRWTKGGKKYVDRELEIVEIHVWGLRNGVKMAVEGFVDQGKKIKVFHTFSKSERHVVEGDAPVDGMMDMMSEMVGYKTKSHAAASQSEPDIDPPRAGVAVDDLKGETPGGADTPTSTKSTGGLSKRTPKLISRLSVHGKQSSQASEDGTTKSTAARTLSSPIPTPTDNDEQEPGGSAVVFMPQTPIRVPTSEVCVTIERRNRAPKSVGLTMVTAVAHVWFNAFFEGHGPEQDGVADEDGVFEIEWDKLDGIKGSSQKGARGCERIAVVWRSVVPADADADEDKTSADAAAEPGKASPVPQMQAADWRGGNVEDPAAEKHLGLRVQSPDSVDVSRASSVIDEALATATATDNKGDEFEGLETDVPAPATQNKGKGKMVEDGDGALEAYAAKLPKPEGN